MVSVQHGMSSTWWFVNTVVRLLNHRHYNAISVCILPSIIILLYNFILVSNLESDSFTIFTFMVTG